MSRAEALKLLRTRGDYTQTQAEIILRNAKSARFGDDEVFDAAYIRSRVKAPKRNPATKSRKHPQPVAAHARRKPGKAAKPRAKKAVTVEKHFRGAWGKRKQNPAKPIRYDYELGFRTRQAALNAIDNYFADGAVSWSQQPEVESYKAKSGATLYKVTLAEPLENPVKKMTLAEAKKEVAALGLKLVRDVEWNEYIVKMPGRPQADYHATELDDAVGTARAMAEHIAKKAAGKIGRTRNPLPKIRKAPVFVITGVAYMGGFKQVAKLWFNGRGFEDKESKAKLFNSNEEARAEAERILPKLPAAIEWIKIEQQ
jgi:hypothetical protein